MIANTFGVSNAGTRPRIGPVVISEVHYNPVGPDDNIEFIEICNAGGVSETLDNWRLRGEADYDFPIGLTIDPGEAMIIVPFDPTNTALADAFYLLYGVAPTTPLYGPWSDGGTPGAKLDDGGAEIRLQRPDALEDPGDGNPPFYPMLVEDTAGYDDDAPWPSSPDGGGDSLLRVDFSSPGDLASSWMASSNPLGDQGYAEWAATAFSAGTPAGDRVETADADLDGLSNFAEFAFVLDPEVAEGVTPVTVGFANDGSLLLTHRRRAGAHGVSYTIESSPDLENWIEVTDATIFGSGVNEVTLDVASGGGRLFLRVSAVAD
jgi:hypothetical protein